jgi:hypothetical protein
MKRLVAVVVMIALAGLGWAAFQTASPPASASSSLAHLMPQGALLFVEGQDFAGLLAEWRASPEKQAWLKSDNYQVFSRSRLLMRLQQAQGEFATAAGVPPDMTFAAEVAGRHTALGIYDIGKLELLYITSLPAARTMQSALWQKRSQFEPREAAGRKFFARTDPESGRTVAFAAEGDYLILATREDLMAGALALLAGQKLATLAAEPWYTDALQAAAGAGELRMAVHLAEVTKTPQFRTYWVQQNITDMQQYESCVVDLHRSAAAYREQRVLLRKGGTDSPDAAEGAERVAELRRLVPSGIGFYRASTATPEKALALLEEKILTPRTGPAPPSQMAPRVALGEGVVGDAASLEVRIDAAPATKTTGKSDDALKSLLASARVRAALELHGSQPAEDGTFVRLHSTVGLAAENDWDEAAVQDAVQRVLAPVLTTATLGAAWKRAGSGPEAYWELDGLGSVALAVRGRTLFVSNHAASLLAVLARVGAPGTAEPALYAAAFDHARERQNFLRLTSLVDRPSRPGGSYDRTPQFFSQNLASLSQVWAGVQSESVVVKRSGRVETQTVQYEWSR